MLRAAKYRRISDDREGRELGVTRQDEDLDRLAERIGAVVVEDYCDNDISASSRTRKKRPEYQRMLADARAGKFDVILAYTTGRLTRRPREHEDLIDLALEHGIRYAYVASPSFDLATAAGRRVARILAASDAGEPEDIAERLEREAQQRAERGVPNGGRRAFGYTADGRELYEPEVPAGRGMYEAHLAGRSLSGIAADVNAAGHTTTMGGPWAHNSVRAFLLNPRNAGLRSYKGEIVGKAVWPALVPEDVWRTTDAQLRNPRRRTNDTGSGLKYLGTRLYRCGRDGCDTAMISTYREKYADGRRRRVYRCPACYLSRLADPVDQYVSGLVGEWLSQSPSRLARMLAPDPGDRTGDLRMEEKALRDRRKSLASLVADGTLTEMEVRREAARLDERLTEIRVELASKSPSGALAAVALAPDPVAAWHAMEGRAEQQKAVVAALMTVRLLSPHLGRRVFDPRTVEIVWK